MPTGVSPWREVEPEVDEDQVVLVHVGGDNIVAVLQGGEVA